MPQGESIGGQPPVNETVPNPVEQQLADARASIPDPQERQAFDQAFSAATDHIQQTVDNAPPQAQMSLRAALPHLTASLAGVFAEGAKNWRNFAADVPLTVQAVQGRLEQIGQNLRSSDPALINQIAFDNSERTTGELIQEANGLLYDYPKADPDKIRAALDKFANGEPNHERVFDNDDSRKTGTFPPGVASGRVPVTIPKPERPPGAPDPHEPASPPRDRVPSVPTTFVDPGYNPVDPDPPRNDSERIDTGDLAGDVRALTDGLGEMTTALDETVHTTRPDSGADAAARLARAALEEMDAALHTLLAADEENT